MKFKKYAKYLGVAALAFGLVTGCQSTGGSATTEAASTNEQAVQTIIADAKVALAEAKKGDYAWRDTGKIIKKAETALADGNTAKASSLATKALQQSELAKKQSIEQKAAVKKRFSQS